MKTKLFSAGRNGLLLALAAGGAVSLGCSSPGESPSLAGVSLGRQTLADVDLAARLKANATKPSGTDNDGKEFRHGLNRSRFRVGSGTQHVSDPALDKIVGSDGVFATHRGNGSALAVPNATSPAIWSSPGNVAIAKGQNLPARVPPLTNVASVHNEHVLKYFLNAGVPANEVGGVHVTTSMAGSGTKSQSGLDGINGELVAYTTHLERYVDGVPVSGSQAWASFNNRGEVISEGVYWPAISQEVVLRARRIRGIVENADAHARLRAAIKSKIPSLGNEPGRAVITHTHSAYDGPVAVQAAYEVIPAGEGSSVRRFDENGDALPDLGLPAVPPKDPGRP